MLEAAFIQAREPGSVNPRFGPSGQAAAQGPGGQAAVQASLRCHSVPASSPVATALAFRSRQLS